MDVRKKVILVFLVVSLFLVAIKLSIDFPTGLGIYYGNTSATNPEGTIRFTMATMIQVILISPPDNTIFTIPGTTLNVSLTCRVINLTPANITQVKLYSDIFGPFNVTQVVNVTGPAPHTVTFNVSNVPLGTYQWNCEGITSTGMNAFAPSNWRFTIRTLPTPPPGGGGGGTPAPFLEQAAYPLPCIIPPPGLKSWWTFDADLDDFWNASNEGMPAGQPEYIKRKEKDLAILLDGKKDYVMISPDNTYDNLVNGTIDGWVQYKNKADYEVIFSYTDPTKDLALAKHLQVRINPGGDIELEYRDGPNYRIVQPDTEFNFKKHAKNWVHFAVTYEDGEYEWYLNGLRYRSKTVVEEGTPLYWFNDLTDSNTLIGTIGAALEGIAPVNYFRGSIDELEIYNRPLTFYEVNAIYARSKCKIKPPKQPVKEKPELPIIEEAEKILEETRLYQPELIRPIPWWLLVLALLGIAAVMFAYYKGIKKKASKKKSSKKSKKKKHKRKK